MSPTTGAAGSPTPVPEARLPRKFKPSPPSSPAGGSAIRALLVLALASLALAPLGHGATAEGALLFDVTGLPTFGGEPNVEVAPDGTVYVVFPDWPGSRLFRKDAGAPGFVDLGRPNHGYGGGDEDVAVGPDGLLAVAGMYWDGGLVGAGFCSSVTVSRDRGDTWAPTVHGICATERVDRPYVAIDEEGKIWLVQHAYCCLGQHSVHVSRDGGATFEPAGFSSAIGDFPGNLFQAKGRLFAATTCQNQVAVCLTATTTAAPLPAWAPAGLIRMTSPPPGLAHSTGAADDAGNLYLAWTEFGSGGTHAYVARSTDLGLTWSARERVSGGNTSVMPWIVAGAEGRVAVAWYEANVRRDPNDMPSDAAWHVHLAVREAWDAPWQKTVVSKTPNHYGDLCVNGAACHGQGIDRDLLDYFELAAGPDGRLHLAWSDDVAWRVQYAEQVGGLRLR